MNKKRIIKIALAILIPVAFIGTFILAALFTYLIHSLEAERNQARSFRVQIGGIGLVGDPHTNTWLGTGFIVGPPNVIVTCNHVVADRSALTYEILTEQKNINPESNRLTYKTDVIDVTTEVLFPTLDIAILKPLHEDISSITPLPIGDPNSLGRYAMNIGWRYREDDPKSFNMNEVKIDWVNDNKEPHFIQLYCDAIKGYSGSPLFNTDGEAVGILYRAHLNEPEDKRRCYARFLTVVEEYLESQRDKLN